MSARRVRLSGWVNRRRDHGGLLFIDLRDHYGITQCVVEPDAPAFAAADQARSEWVLTLTGNVVARTAGDGERGPADRRGRDPHRGASTVQSQAQELPLPVFGDLDYPEETRLKYRFLDLRRERLHRNITLRSKVISSIRRRMIEQGFTEFQTPILTASSPEGARDFLVPSRLHPGKFYALPQAPQQFKQLIMVAGFDRYFQIAPCFRDEDARADRSPGEFYQLDLEMSFVTQDDVFAAVEPVLHGVFSEFADGRRVSPAPFPHITYEESMLKYGNDKPDLRNPIVIADVSDVFARDDVAFKAFKDKTVRAIPAPGAGAQPRSFFDKLERLGAERRARAGLGYIVLEGDGGKLTGKGPIAKFLPAGRAWQRWWRSAGSRPAMRCSSPPTPRRSARRSLAGQARTRLGRDLGLINESEFRFCWIVDFPMYEWNEDEKTHRLLAQPVLHAAIRHARNSWRSTRTTRTRSWASRPSSTTSCATASSCRRARSATTIPDVMLKAFEIAGYAREETEVKFAGMLNAFRYGAPPHGGTAPGIDRIVMLIAGEENLREVTMFPMNQQAQDLMMNAPSEVSPKQLRELHIRTVAPETK